MPWSSSFTNTVFREAFGNLVVVPICTIQLIMTNGITKHYVNTLIHILFDSLRNDLHVFARIRTFMEFLLHSRK